MSLPRQADWRSRSTDSAAAVAGPATRRVLLSEISPEEDASAFLGLGVISDGPKPVLALVSSSLELREEIAGASPKSLKRNRNIDTALRIALDEACLLQV